MLFIEENSVVQMVLDKLCGGASNIVTEKSLLRREWQEGRFVDGEDMLPRQCSGVMVDLMVRVSRF